MSLDDPSPKLPAIRLLLAALLGFLIADLLFLFIHESALLQPSRWSSLPAVLISGVILYLAIGLLFGAFMLLIYLLSFLIRRPLKGTALALTTVIATPLFLVIQQKLQEAILGTYISLKSPVFFVPTGITLLLLLVVVGLVAYGQKLLTGLPSFLRFLGTFRGVLVACAGVFLLVALVSSRHVNVLGIFSDENQRSLRMQREVSQIQAPMEQAPNFIVLVIECWRTDHFSPELTPFLWQLSQENVRFDRYHVVAPATRPSVTSFFTGIYPAQHKCYNLAFNDGSSDQQALVRVSDSVQAFPAVLQENGYRTIMITSNSLTMDPVFGFQDVFNRFSSTDPYNIRIPTFQLFQGFYFLKDNLHHSRVFKVVCFSPQHSTTYFDAPRVNTTVQRELAGVGEDPFFLYVHYMEPHAPYYTRPYKPIQVNLYSRGRKPTLQAAYREEVRAMDQALAQLFTGLQQSGLLENTYVLITADHGEEFLDHGNWGHGKNLYPETMRVPALLIRPGDHPSRQVADVVESIDMAPTFLDLAGIAPPEIWEGQTLFPSLQGASDPALSQAFGQFDNEYVFQATVNSTDWQLIIRRTGEDESIQLYRLSDDPLCKENLAGQGLAVETELVALLTEKLELWELTSTLFQGEEEVVDEQHLQQLKALGYVH